MEEILELLQAYLSNAINAETFVDRYIDLWRRTRDAEYEAIYSDPERRASLQRLNLLYNSGEINGNEYALERARIENQVEGLPIPPHGEAARIRDHIMVEADAYNGDPDIRDSYQIGEEELRATITEGYEQLKALASSMKRI